MGAAATIGGVILLAIGLVMVVGGGAAAIAAMCIGQSYGSCNSDELTFIGGVIFFWIGMVPTVFGVRLIAKTPNIDKLQEDVDLIKKELNDQLSKQTLSKTEIHEIAKKHEEEKTKSEDYSED